jgi:hypothetical protein
MDRFDERESKVRLDAALDLLALSSARLKDVIFSGSDDAVESASLALRLARVQFLVARSTYHEGLHAGAA